MSTHNELATGEFTGPLGARRADTQWQKLKELLKEHGPDRTIEQWKQTWKDIKKNARYENAAAARGHNATGNVQTVPSVSDTSTKVLNIIGHECSTGIGPEESAIGLADDVIEIEVLEEEFADINDIRLPPPPCLVEEVENIPPTPPTTTTTSKNRKERSDEAFQRLQAENNTILQSIDERLRERNTLLRQQNSLLREQNMHLAQKNRLKRLQRFPRR